MTTTLTITSGQTSFTAQGYTILPSPGTAVPDNLAQAILSAANTAGVVLSSSAGTGVITVPARRFTRSGVGPPLAGEGFWLLGDELLDSANAEWECSAPGNPGTWTTAQSGTFASVAQAARLTTQAARAPAVARVLDKFLTGGTGLAVGRVGTTYSLYRGIYPGLFAKYDLILDSAEPGSYALHQLQALSVISPMLSKPYGDATFASTGTWTAGTNAAAYNGGYAYSTTTGDSKTFTSPACTALGLRIPRLTNGGLYAKVSIDGDLTKATALPSAQDEITAGRLASTALVANGGTLNPTDRIFNSYVSTAPATNYDTLTGLAAGLTSAVHTVVVTNTGYAQGGLTSQRLYFAGASYATATAQPTDASTVQMPVGILCALNSAWEHACEVTPAGATTPTFLGNVHGYEVEDSFAVAVDGTATTLTDGQIVAGTQNVAVTRVGHLLHPETGTTKVADTQVVYTVGRYGLTIDDAITWAVAGTLTRAFSMMPLNGALSLTVGATKFARAGLLEYPGGPLTFTGGNGDTYVGASKSAAGWLWGGNFGVLMHMPDVETYTNDWALSQFFTRVEDRNGSLTKIYIGRLWGNAEAFTAGTKLAQKTVYTTGYFPSGAEATLAVL